MRSYRIDYIAREWVGKPDPNGVGRCEMHYTDPSAAHERALRLRADGHKVLAIVPVTRAVR